MSGHAERYAARRTQERVPAALLSAAIVALLGWALIAGLGVSVPSVTSDALKIFSVVPPPPKPPPPPPTPDIVRRHRTPRPEGAAAPPNLKAKPTEVVAPEPIVPVTIPPPVVSAKVAGPGTAASAGAAPIPGPGTGAGGIGIGTGSGGRGNGDGGGGGGGRETGPRLIRDDHRGIRFPQSAPAGLYRLTIRYAVEPDGSVADCRIIRSSGNTEIDGMTCSNAERRLLYKPCRDEEGRAVLCWIVRDEEWTIQHDRADRRG